MAYTINGKVYTHDAPLLDEIIHNTKLILSGIVVKNEKVALDYETEESINNGEYFVKAHDKLCSFENCPMPKEMFLAYGYSDYQSAVYYQDRNKVPEAERPQLLSFAQDYYVYFYFVETNKYYRMLLGLPEYGTNSYNIYLTEDDIPSGYASTVDLSIPIHEQPSDVIAMLRFTGRIDALIKEYKGFNYGYLRYLGEMSINTYTARTAGKWDILYMPDVESTIQNRFTEIYNRNKEIYLKRVYQDAYAFSSEYYDHCMIIMLLAETFNDIVCETPDWYIRRDIFDIRSVQMFLDAYGVEFFQEIPLKYQVRIVKNLNKLLKYKSSEQNIDDIIEIFNIEGAEIYKYYLYKKKKSNYSPGGDFTLEFIKCKLGDTYDNYIKNTLYRSTYDDITLADKYWDGEYSHEYVKQKILNTDFTIEPTKYLSVDVAMNYSEYSKQIKYFLGLILDYRIDDDVYFPVAAIAEGVSFNVSDLFLFISLLTAAYNERDTKVLRPEDIEEEKTIFKPDFVPTRAEDERWQKSRYPEIYTEKYNRVYGFNPNVDKAAIEKIIGRGYVNYDKDGGHYTLADFGLDTFNIGKIRSVGDLVGTYDTNIKCYDALERKILYKADTQDEYKFCEYLFEEFFTKEFDYNSYSGISYMEEKLQQRDYTLYTTYHNIMIEGDKDTVKENVKIMLNNVIDTLEFYLSRENLSYLFTFTPVSSFASILRYLYMILSTFKSYKVSFLDPSITYIMDGRVDNFGGSFDTINYHTSSYARLDKQYQNDSLLKTVFLELEDYDTRFTALEILDIYKFFDPNPDDDYIYDGGESDQEEYDKVADGSGSEFYAPYEMLDGNEAYMNARMVDSFNIHGGSPDTESSDRDFVVRGGGPLLHEEEWFNNSQFIKNFTNYINGGNPGDTDYITRSYFTRTMDDQESIDTSVATFTGLSYHPSLDALSYFKEEYRKWDTLNDFAGANRMYILSHLYNDHMEVSIENKIWVEEQGVINILDLGTKDESKIIYIREDVND